MVELKKTKRIYAMKVIKKEEPKIETTMEYQEAEETWLTLFTMMEGKIEHKWTEECRQSSLYLPRNIAKVRKHLMNKLQTNFGTSNLNGLLSLFKKNPEEIYSRLRNTTNN